MKKIWLIITIIIITAFSLYGETNYFICNRNGTLSRSINNASMITNIPITYTTNEFIFDNIMYFVNSTNTMYGYTTNSVQYNETNITQFTTSTVIPIIPTEAEWQNQKPTELKYLENLYINFLTNEWTTILQNNGVIATNYVITVENTSAQQNTTYLLMLRALDVAPNKPTYSYFKSEFADLRNEIERLGGVMDKIVLHPEVMP